MSSGNKVTRESLERALMLKERSDIRKKNIMAYFMEFSRFHRPWLKELSEKYKERGDFPIIPMVVLPSYYDDIRDKEVAAFAALLISDNDCFERVQAFREMLGERPWKWFENKEFLNLSLGSVQNERTGGVDNWKIARLFNKLWEECHIVDYETPTLDNSWINYKPPYGSSIGHMVDSISKSQRCSFFDALTYLLEDCGVGCYFYKLRLLLMILGTSDGFGIGLCNVNQEDLKCPISVGMRDFVKLWFPDFSRAGDFDNAIKLFGFERGCDFFYAYLGYKELQKRNPKGCGLYATRYQTWYELGSKMDKSRWKSVMPEIKFD